MKYLQPANFKNKVVLINKNLSKRTNKYLCSLKVNKFRTQSVKLQVRALDFWQALNKTNFNTIWCFNFNKYDQIKLLNPKSKANKKLTINLPVSHQYIAKTFPSQTWFIVAKDTLILINLQSHQISIINIKKLKHIVISTSKQKKTLCVSPNFKQLQKTRKLFQTKINNTSSKIKNPKLFQKVMVKFSKKWFRFEHRKSKRFKRKYDGRDLKKKAPLQSFTKLTHSRFKKQLLKKNQNKFSTIKEMLIIEKNRGIRTKELLKSIKSTAKVKILKKYRKYRKFKLLYKQSKVRSVLRTKYINIGHNIIHKIKSTKRCVSTRHEEKLTQKLKFLKIKLLQRLAFKYTKKKRKPSKFLFKTKNLKSTLKKINKQINYKLKWYNYYEFKSFRWKFQKKRWYFTMSKWKRLSEFRRMLRNAWRNYRKLQKNFLFIKLLRANFKHILGIQESDLLKKWVKIRRGTNSNNAISSVDFLNQSLQLKLDGLSMFLGLVPNRLMAQEFVHFGGLRVNGCVSTNENFSLHQNDILQVDIKVIQEIRALYKDAHWNSVRARLKFVSFLQVQWSLMLFMLVRWPQNYELLEESILNQRWVRFFIRYFPVRVSKYKKAKVRWYKY